ncbi:hypothetical protein RHMOL_Rhmol01G0143300 [Rhododendron molle]|uniref:Uncharacterized protein n=1 Tax=Rhododendron molle TaxID=49168 RepID=A0ACC0Q441_RHOML|nr:hypothetical protein RHMOL_Rhmol01G0143300 [Rhododendron molle]
MGKQKSARKLSLRDFHDHICNDSSLSDVEVVSIVDEDSDFEVANEATIEVPKLPPQTSEAWPALKSPIVPGDKSTTLSGATAMSVEGNKLAGMNAWSSPITSPTKATKKGKLSKQLKKVPVVYENGKVMIPSTIAENGALKWKNAIVGSFVDKRLSYYQVSSWAHREWKIDTEDVVTLDNGFFVFKFKDEEVVDSIIENGPYFCGGKHVILVRWHPGMHLTKGAFSSVPVWVKLYNVPLECWNDEGLSYIASHIGNPLYPDEFTREHSRLTFARVCIEVEATKEIPESFVVDLGYGKPFEIRVEVPWKPQACKVCKTFGHTTNACPKPRVPPPSLEWKVKEKVGEEVLVNQEQIAKARDNGEKAWIEVKKKYGQSTPGTSLAVSSHCHAPSTSKQVGALESCEALCVSSVVKGPNNGDKGVVPSPVVVSPSYFEVLKSSDAISSVVEQVSRTSPSMLIHDPVCERQPANDTVALRRSARFREPPRIPLEGDFIGPNAPNPRVGDPSSPRGETKRKLKEKIKMLKATRTK